jgi:hypothetical protein
MAHHIFQLESELQNIPEAAPKASPSFSVSEKLARYGSSALSGVEHLTLLVGKESVAHALIRHFGSLKALARASFQEWQFLPRRKAEAVVAALSMSAIAETEHARSEQLDNPDCVGVGGEDLPCFTLEAQWSRHFNADQWAMIHVRKLRTLSGQPLASSVQNRVPLSHRLRSLSRL